jgi:glycosyltransferase involved in cell wall biosynthesis
MSNPLVSVAMVTCNVDCFLTQSIESILSQTFTEFELIVVDFGSTDNSRSIVSCYAARDERLKFHEIPHCGLAEARNAACSFAKGRYIAVMDADDVSLPGRLLEEVDFMETHPGVGLVGGATEWIDATGKGWGIHLCPTEDCEIKSAFAAYHPFFHPALLIRREAFCRVGGYRSAFAPAEDYDLTMRISEHYGCANLRQVVLRYRIHGSQLSLKKRNQQTLGKLAAQASARSRENGIPDPLNEVAEITPAILARMGVSYERQHHEAASDRYQWIRNMCSVGEHALALAATQETLQYHLQHVERWLIADLRLLAAQLYRKQGKLARSFLTMVHAFITRPVIAGRPVKVLFRRFPLLNRRQMTLSGREL